MLTWFERKRLATCSKATEIFVSGLPMYRFESLKFFIDKREVCKVGLNDSRGYTTCTFAFFYKTYEKLRCTFKKVVFPKGWDTILIASRLRSYEIIPFKCKELIWHFGDSDTIGEMLKYVDQNSIETIRLQDIRSLQNRDIDLIDLPYFKHLELNIDGISAEDAWKLIKGYKTRKHPRGSCFIVKSHKEIHCKDLVALFDVKICNKPIANIPAVHTQQFQQSDKRLVLVVMIHSTHFEGIICGVNSIKEDFQAATGGVFSKKSI